MTHWRLLIESLRFYWRTHLAVLLGVAAGAAVIAGALIVGDSVRASLKAMSLARLGAVDFAVSGGRFVTDSLPKRLEKAANRAGSNVKAAGALSLQAGLTHETDGQLDRAGDVGLYALDDKLWAFLDHGALAPPAAGQIILNQKVADDLNVAVGDSVDLNIEIPSEIPRESLLGERNELTRQIPLAVSAILTDAEEAGRFGMNPSQQIPAVAFANLVEVQDAIGLAALPASRRNPTPRPGRVNSVYIATGEDTTTASALEQAKSLNTLLQEALTLDDLNLRIVPAEKRGYISLESRQMIIGESTEQAANAAARAFYAPEGLSDATSPVYVYLVNELASLSDPSHYSMYSVVAGIDFDSLDHPAFGPFEYLAGGPPKSNDEIVLNEFAAGKQLEVKVGDEITLSYYTVGSHGELPEETRAFRVSGIVALGETAAADPHLTPQLEGITDAGSFSDWEQPFEMDLGRITDADEAYWDEHRAVPKAFLGLEAAQGIFRSRFGELTSFRVAIPNEADATEFAESFEEALLKNVDLRPLGLLAQPVKYQGIQAAAGTTSFAGLFIGFSLFIIISAAILIGLLFRLGVEQRAGEIGLLAAVGFGARRIRRWSLAEALCVLIAGALVGTLAGIGYAWAMVLGLTTVWRGAIGTRFLFVDVQPASLAIGFSIALAIALAAVWWGLKSLKRLTPRALLAGEREYDSPDPAGRRRQAFWMAVATIASALLLVAAGLFGLIPGSEAFGGFSWQVIAFFVAGILLLTGGLAGFSAWLRREPAGVLRHSAMLGFRNTARRRRRSVSTVGLIASATFVLVAVAASQRDPAAAEPRRDSGNGGFLLLGESTIPLPHAIDTAEGREKLGMRLEIDSKQQQKLLGEMEAISFRVRPGDDASCLNLYQTGLPTILGVPDAMIDRGGFRFTATPGAHPWELLKKKLPPTTIDGREIPTLPVFGDANTLMYSLKKGMGDRIYVPDKQSADYVLQVAGMFDGSPFQGMLLMSEANFLRLYPGTAGYGYFLIDADPSRRRDISRALETGLAPYGFVTVPVAQRIAEFLVVQNTYLKTFRALGGLGLLLGTIGLGTVMLRNVLDRRGELALMRGVGFRKIQLTGMVLAETALLLAWGLACGTLAALLAVSPHLMRRGAEIPVRWGLAMLVAVAVAGILAAWLAARAAVRTPIVATLRGE